jgi:hypothetical protein
MKDNCYRAGPPFPFRIIIGMLSLGMVPKPGIARAPLDARLVH